MCTYGDHLHVTFSKYLDNLDLAYLSDGETESVSPSFTIDGYHFVISIPTVFNSNHSIFLGCLFCDVLLLKHSLISCTYLTCMFMYLQCGLLQNSGNCPLTADEILNLNSRNTEDIDKLEEIVSR